MASELGLDNTAAGAEQLLIDQWLNQAVRDVLLRTHLYVASTTQAIVAATTDYQLASTILALLRVVSPTSGANAGRDLRYVSADELFEMRRLNLGLSDFARSYAVMGSNLLLIYPSPSTNETWTLYYVPKPTEMTTGANDPSTVTFGNIPTEFHRALELYAFWKGASYDDDASSKIGAEYERQYELFLAKVIRPAVNRKGGARMPSARIGARTTILPSRNDVYPS